MNLSQLSKIAIKAARAAGTVIQKHMNDEIKVEKKEGGDSYASQVVTAVDIACEKVILSHLLPTCDEFNLALLTEESVDNGSRFEEDYFWCIDPMDGTLAFIQGQPGFSVSVALVEKDGTPCIGVVFDPSTDTMYHAIQGNGAFKNGSPWKIKHGNRHLTYVTDRKLKDTPRAAEIESLLHEQVKKLGLSGVTAVSYTHLTLPTTSP